MLKFGFGMRSPARFPLWRAVALIGLLAAPAAADEEFMLNGKPCPSFCRWWMGVQGGAAGGAPSNAATSLANTSHNARRNLASKAAYAVDSLAKHRRPPSVAADIVRLARARASVAAPAPALPRAESVVDNPALSNVGEAAEFATPASAPPNPPQPGPPNDVAAPVSEPPLTVQAAIKASPPEMSGDGEARLKLSQAFGGVGSASPDSGVIPDLQPLDFHLRLTPANLALFAVANWSVVLAAFVALAFVVQLLWRQRRVGVAQF